jgi:hypothetical protein
MVVRILVGYFFALALAGLAQAQPQLKLILDKSEVQLGRHITAKLYGIDLPTRLSEINTQALSEDFGLVILESSEDDEDDNIVRLWPNRRVQTMQFALYPRRSGALTIPELNLAGTYTQTQTVQVSQSTKKTRDGEIAIEQEIVISTQHPWERQQVRIAMTITSADQFISLRTETPRITGFEVFALPESSQQIRRNGVDYTRISTGWVLFPLTAGTHTLDLPAIELRKSGRTQRTFYLPKQTLKIKALPPYIPPTMPVGKIDVSASLNTGHTLFPETLYYWNVSLSGTGVSPHWLPPVLRQIKTNDDVHFLPTDSEQAIDFNQSGMQSQITHRIPFKAKHNGRLKLPDLRIQYFAPDTGKIETITYQPKIPFVLSMGWRLLIAAFLCLLLFRAGQLLYQRIAHSVKRHRLRQSAFQQIKTATSADDIRHGLSMLSAAENWPTNLTLRQWAAHWKNSYKVNAHFDPAFNWLSQACYQTNQPMDIKALRSAIFQQLFPQ